MNCEFRCHACEKHCIFPSEKRNPSCPECHTETLRFMGWTEKPVTNKTKENKTMHVHNLTVSKIKGIMAARSLPAQDALEKVFDYGVSANIGTQPYRIAVYLNGLDSSQLHSLLLECENK